jgi:hypothetical protein
MSADGAARRPYHKQTTGPLFSRVMLARLCAAYHQLAPKEFLIVQFFDRAFRFVHGLHLHKGETLRTLVVAIAHNLRVLHVADPVEQFEEIAFRRVERQIADIKPRRGYLD